MSSAGFDSDQPEPGELLVSGPYGNKVVYSADRAAINKAAQKEKRKFKKERAIQRAKEEKEEKAKLLQENSALEKQVHNLSEQNQGLDYFLTLSYQDNRQLRAAHIASLRREHAALFATADREAAAQVRRICKSIPKRSNK